MKIIIPITLVHLRLILIINAILSVIVFCGTAQYYMISEHGITFGVLISTTFSIILQMAMIRVFLLVLDKEEWIGKLNPFRFKEEI